MLYLLKEFVTHVYQYMLVLHRKSKDSFETVWAIKVLIVCLITQIHCATLPRVMGLFSVSDSSFEQQTLFMYAYFGHSTCQIKLNWKKKL